ncbi:MAG: rubrerythrin family protein [Actinobacteria bacterium]|nr:rubrerythrin family protein [Actinomycetota bacterium]
METKKNLEEAFSGESKASRSYFAFSEKASQEGFKNLSRLFKAAAYSETIHARNHLKALGKVGSSVENLKSAVSGEAYEVAEMYPAFIDIAKNEGIEDAVKTFEWAYETEKAHKEYFEEALNKIENNTDLPDEEIAVCRGCGYTMTGDIPDNCPICGAPKSNFELF